MENARQETEAISEDELCRRVIESGSEDEKRKATEQLLERHYSWLKRGCYFASRDPDTAEDCLQEALLEIARSLPKFRRDSSLKTWMFVIVRRVCGRQRERKTRYRTRFLLGKESDNAENAESKAETEIRTGSHLLSAERQLQLSEEHQHLWGLVRELPEKQKLSVMLHYAEDMGVAEVGEALGCSESAVKTHLSRAKEKLRARLEADGQNKA